jgi:hypothetical protein
MRIVMTGMGCLTSSPGLAFHKSELARDVLRRFAYSTDRRLELRRRKPVAGRHYAQRGHDRPVVIPNGGPHAAESQAALLVVDGVPLIPHAAQLFLQRGSVLDGAVREARQAAAGQPASKFVWWKCGEQDLPGRRRVSGHAADPHVYVERMRTLDQMNADRAKAIQHAEVHGLSGLGPEPLHDGLGHLA